MSAIIDSQELVCGAATSLLKVLVLIVAILRSGEVGGSVVMDWTGTVVKQKSTRK